MGSGSNVDRDVTIGSGSNVGYTYPFGGMCTSANPLDHVPFQEAIENQRIADGRPDDPENKEQSAGACYKYFPLIKKNFPQFADYELVEPMNVNYILAYGSLHMNFKAKPQDADDSSTAVYFAELVPWDDKVTFLKKLDVLPSVDTKLCGFCHCDPDPALQNVMCIILLKVDLSLVFCKAAEGGFGLGFLQS